MNKLITSIESAAASRIKNPLIGTFVLTWCFFNIQGVIIFLLSDSTTKIDIVKNYKFDYLHDFSIPLLISLIYVFALPWFNILLHLVMEKISTINHKSTSKELIKRYREDKKSNRIKVDSDTDNLKLIQKLNVERWAEEKKRYPIAIKELKENYAKNIDSLARELRAVESSLNERRKELEDLEKIYYENLDKINEACQGLSDISTKMYSTCDKFDFVGDVNARNFKLDFDDNSVTFVEYSKVIRESLSEVKSKLEVFDPREDIPF